jgi:predicted CXXCH cytochrome family protein
MRRRHAARVLLALSLTLGFALGAAPAAYASTESTYAAWTSGGANAGSLPTPHMDYATTTTKCATCHAVHKAPAGGELLLRTSVDQSCVYCHVDNHIALTVYGGLASRYNTEDQYGHQSTGVSCVDCHAVHGANTFKGDQTAHILKVWNIQQSLVDEIAGGNRQAVIDGVGPLAAVDDATAWGWAAWWETEFVQPTAFCTQCHPYYSAKSETLVTAQVVQSDGTFDTASFKTHPIKRPDVPGGSFYVEGFVATGSTLPTTTATANHGPLGCSGDCHFSPGPDGINTDHEAHDPENSFPHYNSYTPRFLAGGAEQGTEDTITTSQDDAACLYCHVWDDGSGHKGVGISY